MFPNAVQPQKNLLPFGIPSLDEILGGGIPTGSIVLIEDEIGAEANPFILQFLAEGLKAGQYGYIMATEHPYQYFAEMLSGIGVNTDMLKATGRLKFIDAFSNPFGYTDLRSEHDLAVRNISQPRELNEIIRRAFLHVRDQNVIKRGIVSSLSSIIYAADESKKTIFSFLQNRLASNKLDGSVTLFSLHYDAHPRLLVKAMEHLSDVTIRVKKGFTKEERPLNVVQVINIKGKPELAGESVQFEFISGKIIPYYKENLF